MTKVTAATPVLERTMISMRRMLGKKIKQNHVIHQTAVVLAAAIKSSVSMVCAILFLLKEVGYYKQDAVKKCAYIVKNAITPAIAATAKRILKHAVSLRKLDLRQQYSINLAVGTW